jgi:hypothetical protein
LLPIINVSLGTVAVPSTTTGIISVLKPCCQLSTCLWEL